MSHSTLESFRNGLERCIPVRRLPGETGPEQDLHVSADVQPLG